MLADGRCWSWWRWWWVRTRWANHKSLWERFGVLRVKHQKTRLNRSPIAYTVGGEGSVLTQHQSRDMETDGQCNTHKGSSGWPSALLEISYFTRECSTQHFTIIILGLEKMTNSQDWFPVVQTVIKICNFLLICPEKKKSASSVVHNHNIIV